MVYRRTTRVRQLISQKPDGVMVKFLLYIKKTILTDVNPLNVELNPIRCLLALLGAHHFLHVSRIRVKSLTLRLSTHS